MGIFNVFQKESPSNVVNKAIDLIRTCDVVYEGDWGFYFKKDGFKLSVSHDGFLSRIAKIGNRPCDAADIYSSRLLKEARQRYEEVHNDRKNKTIAEFLESKL